MNAMVTIWRYDHRAAQYTYDPYGKLRSATGTIAEDNPLRYRGYYYDTETGFYYLISRYYDPAICRFISADDVSCLGANGDIISLNLFAYCGNDPVNKADEAGFVSNFLCGLPMDVYYGFKQFGMKNKCFNRAEGLW